MKKTVKRRAASLLKWVTFLALIIFSGGYLYVAANLPNVQQLKDVGLQTPLRIYTHDAQLIAEFGEKRRIPVKLHEVPKKLIQAIIDTEDQRFFEHSGVDFFSLVRAALVLITTGKRSQGASTITMQVARNFFLHHKKTFGRKFNEILLAFSINKNFTKEAILELYLNKIYFGNRAYGVAAAAQVYFGKKLQDLTLAEIAVIAGLPQAPSRDNPLINPKIALERRNHVLRCMYNNHHITEMEYQLALKTPIGARYHATPLAVSAPYVAEMVRNYMVQQYGEKAYESGLEVYTTIDARLQHAANQALVNGIIAYDRRHGYRGVEGTLVLDEQGVWREQLQRYRPIQHLLPAIVTAVTPQLTVELNDRRTIALQPAAYKWANTQFNLGDIIRVYQNMQGEWQLGQIPEIEGALISLDTHTGAITALCGGFSYAKSNFNRVTQALRQTGSVFKPFVYAAALDKGFTLASILNDAPVVFMDPTTQKLWRPQNNSRNFYGPTSLRTAMVYSRNLVSIRLLQEIGVPYALRYIQRFGFAGKKELPAELSLALGAGSATPLKLTAAYAVFANGGYRIEPYVIERVVSHNLTQQVIYQVPVIDREQALPKKQRILSEATAYLVSDMLRSVITRGTGYQARVLKRSDLAGKTGSTSDLVDGWFIGFNHDIVTTVWTGFDQPRSTEEHGSRSSLPIWINFMREALRDQPESFLLCPEDVVAVRIDPHSGLLATADQKDAIFEIFMRGTEPTEYTPTYAELDGEKYGDETVAVVDGEVGLF